MEEQQLLILGFYKATSCLVNQFRKFRCLYFIACNDVFLGIDEPNQCKVVELTRLVKEFLNVDSNKLL